MGAKRPDATDLALRDPLILTYHPMTIQSLDPRVTRLGIPTDAQASDQPKPPLDQLETFEVFHQLKRGAQPVHVGSLHASSPELALVLAKEQYARRGHCVGLWVARTSDVFTIGVEDEDVFETTPAKNYREAGGYQIGNRLTEFKRRMARQGEGGSNG